MSFTDSDEINPSNLYWEKIPTNGSVVTFDKPGPYTISLVAEKYLLLNRLGSRSGKLIPKSSLGNEDFALRVTKTLRIKVLSGADDKYQHGDLKRRSINPDIGNERFNFQNKLFKSFISTRGFGSSMRSIKNSIEFFGLIYCR